ncbi:pyridoxamine 5'-phosphate oxidase [Coccomyxa subellipsoidea C-169]|uniref:NAD(P)H-hydrate epimerase n=1 Tax=Coccomyxa subellipsoidea (strain C-169) TaxID=574566 RepID=I0YUC1_COCSC|nr:pyridoxamine 5'-phosphate oxidase [Coccomyxa subellipsoidea C-169]EIE21990.1 pyridoxamine 5'-phosphate oxidase [Coccomyxa subellipsoidea C-169]|eukprot:XP_005646534.1 pyridoxamine 5'-phosphate oxidase [Coccomyxa subellipsoidea C-169]
MRFAIVYRGQDQAVAIDEELMGPLGFSVDQLMEVAGLSVACSLASEYPAASHPRILVVAGPGNNGGDGLVAARHLFHFGYSVQVLYPKKTDKPLYHGLVTQLKSCNIPFLSAEDILDGPPLKERYDVIIDAIFGFSFKGSPRPPFDKILERLKPHNEPPAIASVDMPSGWHVENGDEIGDGLRPEMLVSLTTPKRGAQFFEGPFHYLGGRFVPPIIKEKYKLNLPPYPGTSQCVKLSGSQAAGNNGEVDPASIRLNYSLADVSGGLLESDVDPDPLKQFDSWFKDAVEAKVLEEPNQMALASADERGVPSVRMVLLKGYDARGFAFYTNYDSRKACELANGHAALCMYWEPLQRQVRVEGTVEKLPEEESDAYYHSRPRGSQLGAHVSPQSTVLEDGRASLEDRNTQLKELYADESKEIPRPKNWGGFLIRPKAIEFWHGRPSRLHDRLRYQLEDGQWSMDRLAP